MMSSLIALLPCFYAVFKEEENMVFDDMLDMSVIEEDLNRYNPSSIDEMIDMDIILK